MTRIDTPYRSGSTWLSDDQLIVLDVIFDGGAPWRLLRKASFCDQWNLAYSHNLDDASLAANLQLLCERGIVETSYAHARAFFGMTAHGGSLWSAERCPIWDRYCTERYKRTQRGRTIMSVAAVSPDTRDDFLRLWPLEPARRKKTIIADRPLIGWRSFPRVYVGIAIYEDPTHNSTHLREALNSQHGQNLAQQRSWWRSIAELQRFLR